MFTWPEFFLCKIHYATCHKKYFSLSKNTSLQQKNYRSCTFININSPIGSIYFQVHLPKSSGKEGRLDQASTLSGLAHIISSFLTRRLREVQISNVSEKISLIAPLDSTLKTKTQLSKIFVNKCKIVVSLL